MKTPIKKILIVEDDKPILYSLTKKFNLVEGLKVLYAEDGDLALKMALKEKPNLILLDVILPKMDGVEMLKKLRQDKRGKDIKVIILSNLSDPAKESTARELGVIDYIIKADWKIDNVIEKVLKQLK
ncbi:MAG: response regulator [Patescibacteria group bacterium]